MGEIKQPAYGELILNWIHCPDCSASRSVEVAMRRWRYRHPEIQFNIIGRKRLGVEESLENYFYIVDKETGLKMKALPVYFITWSERPRWVLWRDTGGVRSENYRDVEGLYKEIEEGFEIARRKVNEAIKKGYF